MEQNDDFILVLWEVPFHPNSYLNKLTSRFETPSVVRVTKKEELRKYKAPPLFDAKYLVIFETLKSLQDNFALIHYAQMFPVLLVENRAQFDDALFFLNTAKGKYRVFHNEFLKEDAIAFVAASAKEQVSESFCKAVVRHVGLSPLRIMTALSVCDQMGYTIKNLERYVDKYVYLDQRKLIEALLGVPRSKASLRASFLYLQLNRHWYRYVQKDLLDELTAIIQIYKDKLSGVLRKETVFIYMDERSLTRSQVTYALSLFDKVSLVNVFSLREFIKSASLLEVVSQLS